MNEEVRQLTAEIAHLRAELAKALRRPAASDPVAEGSPRPAAAALPGIAEHTLREKSEEFDVFFANALDLLCIADTSGTFRRVNPAWEATLGYPVAHLEGSRFLDFVHPDDLTATGAAIRQLSQQRQVINFVNRYRAADGSYRWIEWRSMPMGELVYAAARDITERKRVEQELDAARRMLQLVLDTIPVRVFWKDTTGGFLGCNRAFARDAGFDSPAELLGKSDDDMGWREQAELYRQDDRLVMQSGIPKVAYEEPQTTPTGGQLWLRTSKTPLLDPEGRTIGVLGTYEDVTERKRAEQARASLEMQLLQAQKLESVGRLAGGVAHDFNNMLTVILGSVELIKRRRESDAALLRELAEIEQAGNRARAITGQLLAFSRRQVAAPRPLNWSEFLLDSRSTLGRLIGEDIALSFHLDSELWMVRMDPAQADQILMNLGANARDAMPEGGTLSLRTQNVQVDASLCRQHVGLQVGDYVQLTVSDDGIGMDRETLISIFEPFFTTKALGQGTGLGLATVYGIVSQNGGALAVRSEVGRGATFDVFLPRSRGESAALPTAVAAAGTLRGGTVLLVEDDAAVRQMTAAMLAVLGLEVLVASEGSEAIALLNGGTTPIDLLLTDVVMPGSSGRELAEQIRALRPELPVLFMSGYTADVIARHGVLDEGVHFIQKPFGLAELSRQIGEALRAG